jgi:hypothetical protein
MHHAYLLHLCETCITVLCLVTEPGTEDSLASIVLVSCSCKTNNPLHSLLPALFPRVTATPMGQEVQPLLPRPPLQPEQHKVQPQQQRQLPLLLWPIKV